MTDGRVGSGGRRSMLLSQRTPTFMDRDSSRLGNFDIPSGEPWPTFTINRNLMVAAVVGAVLVSLRWDLDVRYAAGHGATDRGGRCAPVDSHVEVDAGRTGMVGGGWRSWPPRAISVPWAGGACPTSGVVPIVTSTVGWWSSTPTPATPPVAPVPADTEAATSG